MMKIKCLSKSKAPYHGALLLMFYGNYLFLLSRFMLMPVLGRSFNIFSVSYM